MPTQDRADELRLIAKEIAPSTHPEEDTTASEALMRRLSEKLSELKAKEREEIERPLRERIAALEQYLHEARNPMLPDGTPVTIDELLCTFGLHDLYVWEEKQ